MSKKRVKNTGIMPQYYVEGDHEAIIPKDIYMQVQEEMLRRANLHSGAKRKKRVYSNKHDLSGRVYCSKCGDIYRRVIWNSHGNKYPVWMCCTRTEYGPGSCDGDAIKEADLHSSIMQAINRLLGNRDSVKEILAANIETALTEVDGIPIDEIDAKLEELQKELLKVANSKGNYDSITDEIYRLREMKQNAMADSAEREGLKLRIDEMRQFLDEQTESITEYDEKLTRRLIEKITVYEDHFTIEFKSGTSMDVHR